MMDHSSQWHDTETDDSAPIAKIEQQTTKIPVSTSFSRMPSAIIGIFAVALVGVAFVHGYGNYRGQVALTANENLSAIEVHLTDSGASPALVTLRPGMQLVWINDGSLPQVLQSETLRDGSGKLLNTSAIFPGDRQIFILSKDQIPGSFTYASITSTVKGSIEVAGNTSSSSVNNQKSSAKQASKMTTSASSHSASSAKSEKILVSTDVASSVASHSSASTVALPKNPYTVEKQKSGATSQVFPAAPEKEQLLKPTSRPPSQPSSGPELEIAITAIISIMVFGWITRKSFAR